MNIPAHISGLIRTAQASGPFQAADLEGRVTARTYDLMKTQGRDKKERGEKKSKTTGVGSDKIVNDK